MHSFVNFDGSFVFVRLKINNIDNRITFVVDQHRVHYRRMNPSIVLLIVRFILFIILKVTYYSE